MPNRKVRTEQKAAEASIAALSKVKSVYAERGDVNSCGDWLALALKESFHSEDGSFDLTAFKACLKENDIEAPKVDMERHGAIGRFRMCARLMLLISKSSTSSNNKQNQPRRIYKSGCDPTIRSTCDVRRSGRRLVGAGLVMPIAADARSVWDLAV